MTDGDALVVSGLTKRYGSVVAVDDVDFRVPQYQRLAIIGPNGAGKSTLFALIGGTMAPTTGRVLLLGHDVTRMRDYQRARMGLLRTFQTSSVFGTKSLLENVELGTRQKLGRPYRLLGRGGSATRDAAMELLERVGLADRAMALASALSHGERRQLELALALGAMPKVLLLDEPTSGMSAAETARFVELVLELPREITILVIEHDLDVVFGVADRVLVLHLGAVLADGPPEEIRGSEVVQRVYLGDSDDPLMPPESRSHT